MTEFLQVHGGKAILTDGRFPGSLEGESPQDISTPGSLRRRADRLCSKR